MIRAQDLSKYFGTKRALGPVSFEIADGESVGFLGLNGAGKTTALRIFACDLRPSSGTVKIGDIDAVAHPHEVRKRIGFLPENPPLYLDMQVTDYLRFAGRIRGMSAQEVDRRLPQVFELTDLHEARDEIVGNLSHGFRQRVGVAQAIVHDPRLLILDEPTRGLDPVQIVEMRLMIQNLKKKHTVLISSHILSEIEKTCDRILLLQRGAVIANVDQDLDAGAALEVAVRSGASAGAERGPGMEESVRQLLEKVDGVTKVQAVAGEQNAITFRLRSGREVRPEVCRALVEGGHDVLKIGRAGGELESMFLNLVKGGATDESN
jgi:ABC-2 type transport system ATP-binding protein